MDVNYQEIGRRIAQRRKELGFRQTSVCEMCGISDKYLSGIERARSIPSLDVLLRICHALETTPDALLLGVSSGAPDDFYRMISQKLAGCETHDLQFILSFIDWYLVNRLAR